MWGIIEAPRDGWTDPMILAAFGIAAVLLSAFVAWELRTREPMLDVRLFRNPRFSAASAAITLAFFAMFGTVFFLTQYLQSVLGFSALEAGVRVLPVAAGLVIGGPISARLAERVGTKFVVAAGHELIAAALALMTGYEVDSGYGFVALTQVILGLGIGHRDGPRDGVDHGLAAARQGQRRLRGQRRDTHDRRRARRRGARVAPVQRLPCGHGRRRLRPSRRPADTARDSLGGAMAVAAHGGGSRLVATAQEAFVSGMHTAVIVAARDRPGRRVIALVFLPARASERRPSTRRAGGARRMSSGAATAPPGRTPGRPRRWRPTRRSSRRRSQLLIEDGYRGLTHGGGRARSGVGKATLYRRSAPRRSWSARRRAPQPGHGDARHRLAAGD